MLAKEGTNEKDEFQPYLSGSPKLISIKHFIKEFLGAKLYNYSLVNQKIIVFLLIAFLMYMLYENIFFLTLFLPPLLVPSILNFIFHGFAVMLWCYSLMDAF